MIFFFKEGRTVNVTSNTVPKFSANHIGRNYSKIGFGSLLVPTGYDYSSKFNCCLETNVAMHQVSVRVDELT